MHAITMPDKEKNPLSYLNSVSIFHLIYTIKHCLRALARTLRRAVQLLCMETSIGFMQRQEEDRSWGPVVDLESGGRLLPPILNVLMC